MDISLNLQFDNLRAFNKIELLIKNLVKKTIEIFLFQFQFLKRDFKQASWSVPEALATHRIAMNHATVVSGHRIARTPPRDEMQRPQLKVDKILGGEILNQGFTGFRWFLKRRWEEESKKGRDELKQEKEETQEGKEKNWIKSCHNFNLQFL